MMATFTNEITGQMDIFYNEKIKLISKVLLEMGMRADTSGYLYAKEAIGMVMDDTKRKKICNDIYPAIAVKFNATAQQVERNIRFAIDKMESDYDCNIDKYFSKIRDHYTNKEFIYGIAEYVKYIA
mgnify:FL=1